MTDTPPKSELILYQTEDGQTRIQCRFEGDTLWLTQAQIAGLFQTTPQNITLHLKELYLEGEIDEAATCKPFLQVRQEGSRSITRSLLHYNLEAILAVGYRVRSHRGTQFRQWATARLSEYLVKGFTLDDERLKHPRGAGGIDYFDELLARIREIRASEQRVYQRIRDIFALASDYRESDRDAQRFFATMQNKMHYAASGLTAAEIVRRRANAARPNMGLTTWTGDRVQKRDVGTAKNYLDAKEIDTLNRIVVMFLDQADFRAQRRQDIKMADWALSLDKFLRDTELPVLASAGTVTHEAALEWANEQYEGFAERRQIEAENRGEERYFSDLEQTAKALASATQKREAPPARRGKPWRPAKGKRGKKK